MFIVFSNTQHNSIKHCSRLQIQQFNVKYTLLSFMLILGILKFVYYYYKNRIMEMPFSCCAYCWKTEESWDHVLYFKCQTCHKHVHYGRRTFVIYTYIVVELPLLRHVTQIMSDLLQTYTLWRNYLCHPMQPRSCQTCYKHVHYGRITFVTPRSRRFKIRLSLLSYFYPRVQRFYDQITFIKLRLPQSSQVLKSHYVYQTLP